MVGMVGTSRDVTERRRLEEQMRQAQKLEALGLLAGSVAHDFNNLLSVIIGGTELARAEVRDGPALDDLDAVHGAATRAAQLTRQLLAFSRRRVRQPRVLDLRDVVRDGEALLRRLLPEDVVLDVGLGDTPCFVHADPAQLEQVLLNLVLNARDAVLARRAKDASGAPESPPIVTVDVEARAGVAALVVRDTGIGMDASTQARAFEPFFTTKGAGHGTGLGLATVAGIVAESGGSVQVESTPGAGARFTVLLPLVEPADECDALGALGALGAGAPACGTACGTETVLLVEDEAVVRETATRILVRHGYRVLAARHGNDALLVWRDHAAEIDVLVTDLRMPELDGRALVARLRGERPDLPVVLMSGYAGTDGDTQFLEREIFLAKPFATDTLLGRVREALDQCQRA
jgi:nitrogen-specific signal transduction histidine kinase